MMAEYESLYKYMPLRSERNYNCIKDEYIYLNSIDRFNDPYECSFKIDMWGVEYDEWWTKRLFEHYRLNLKPSLDRTLLAELELAALRGNWTTGQIVRYLGRFCVDEKYQQTITKSAQEAFEIYCNDEIGGSRVKQVRLRAVKTKVENEYYIGCLSRVWDSLLMWAHYTDNYSGVCVEYDTSAIADLCRPVIYSDEYPVESDFLRDTFSIFCHKSSCWEYEQEVRVIRSASDGHYLPLRVKSITVDADKCANYDALFELAKKIRCNLYTIGLATESFRLTRCEMLVG